MPIDKPISEFDTNWYPWWCIQWLAKILGWNQVDLNMVYLMCLTAIFPFWQGCQKHMFSQKQFNSFGGTFKDRDVHSWFYDKGPSLNELGLGLIFFSLDYFGTGRLGSLKSNNCFKNVSQFWLCIYPRTVGWNTT